jgi:hypothetical protein
VSHGQDDGRWDLVAAKRICDLPKSVLALLGGMSCAAENRPTWVEDEAADVETRNVVAQQHQIDGMPAAGAWGGSTADLDARPISAFVAG